MNRYYFHLRNHTEHLEDSDGEQFPDLQAALAEALAAARDTLSHDMKRGTLDLRYHIDVEDADGRLLHSLPFAEAFKVITA